MRIHPGVLFAILMLVFLFAATRGQSTTGKALGKLHRTRFYDTPDPLPPGNPGQLIRAAAFNGYYLPEDVNAVRFLYHSRSAGGADVPVSGVILFPEGKPPAGGWPVIAWAHSWTGVGRGCAPSLRKDLQHGPFLAMYVHVGYAVVATDYAGLGANSRSAFADIFSNATDLINSVSAARVAVPQLGNRWIAMGTREGGTAAIAVGETDYELHDQSFLGSLAVSGLAELEDESLGSEVPSQQLLFLAYGVKTLFPKFEPKDVVTEKGFSAYEKVDEICGGNGAAAEGASSAMLKSNWKDNEFVQKFFERNRLGLHSSAGPVMMITSASDPLISETTKLAKNLCKAGDRVDFEKYSESDPGRVIGDSARDQMAWIRVRFQNRQSQSNCSSLP